MCPSPSARCTFEKLGQSVSVCVMLMFLRNLSEAGADKQVQIISSSTHCLVERQPASKKYFLYA